jgi:very-short-patch-repair endonuclease
MNTRNNVSYKIPNREFGERDTGPSHLRIELQASIGTYRVDFLVVCSNWVPDFENRVKAPDGTEVPGIKLVQDQIIVECDGHDFHERTKQQASRDKAHGRRNQ